MTDATITEPSATSPAAGSRLGARNLAVGYGERGVIEGLDIDVPPSSFTVVIGPNACGKSTLLRSLARLLKPRNGTVLLDGADIAQRRTKEVAREVGLLPQSSTAPEGITVADLVSRGRHPHQGLLRRWDQTDELAVRDALERTDLTSLATRVVDELSGGQRQRVWIAMALAQQTPLLLLDEPTTFLDIAHQLEVLDLCEGLHHEGRTLVAVLHDLNLAVRYATHLVAMRDGRIVAQGDPEHIVTEQLVLDVFGVSATVVADPETGRPLVVPRRRNRSAHPIPHAQTGTP